MNFGIENNILPPPFSMFVSILLFIGCYQLGNFILRLKKLNFIIKKISLVEFQSATFGCLFLIIILFPLSLLGLFNLFFIRIIGLILILFSLYFFLNFKNKKFSFNYKNLSKLGYIFLFLVFYFISSCSPITSADSLDYHTAVAIHLINFSRFPDELFWFHARQAGAGEVLISLGLALGAEEFGSLVQYSGILTIIGVLFRLIKNKNISFKYLWKYYSLLIFFLSSPILIFLVTSNKPQLFFIGLTTLSFVLVFLYFYTFPSNYRFHIFSLVNIFILTSINAKYSFVLSSFLIWIFLIIKIFDKKLIFKYFLIQILLYAIISFPYLLWKIIFFDSSLFNSFFSALPIHLYGYNSLKESLFSRGLNLIPIWIIAPKSLGEITQTLGFGSLSLLYIFKKKNFLSEINIVIFFYFTILLFFGQNNARFFLEPYIWSIINLFNNDFYKKNYWQNKLIIFLVFFQSIITIALLFYYSFNISIGSLSKKFRAKVMRDYTYGYNYIDWANSILPKDSVVITNHRSISLMNFDTISMFYINYIDVHDKKSWVYNYEIKNKNPNYILTSDPNNSGKNMEYLRECFGELVAEKEFNGHVSRNPFNKDHNIHYVARIYKFLNNKFPDCIK
jgi:hypothetical protein